MIERERRRRRERGRAAGKIDERKKGSCRKIRDD